jgi:hypothetical protein
MTEEELRAERIRLREYNTEVLKRELTGKEIRLRSNIFGQKERVYFVDEVKEARLRTPRGNLFGVRLVNLRTEEENQPFLRYPTSEIRIERIDEKKRRMTLIYSPDVDIERDFRRLHRKTKPDMIITITYACV